MTNEQEAQSQSKRHNGTRSANLCEDTLLKRCHIRLHSYVGGHFLFIYLFIFGAKGENYINIQTYLQHLQIKQRFGHPKI